MASNFVVNGIHPPGFSVIMTGPLAKLETPPCGQEGKSELEIKHCSVAEGAVYAGYSRGPDYSMRIVFRNADSLAGACPRDRLRPTGI